MALDFKLPDIGEGIAEGEIVKWLVAEGDAVAEHQPVVEVMTDKATVEIPAPQAGTISKLLVAEGDVVPVGDVIFVLDGAGAGTAAPQAASAPAQNSAAAAGAASGAQTAPAGATVAEAGSGGGSGKLLEFKLPDIGEGIAEGEIVQWLVEEGAMVEEHQAVVEVMTDKATVEIPAPASGRLVKRLVAAGDVVPIGTVLFHLETEAGAAAPASQTAGSAPAAASQPAVASGVLTRRDDGKVLAVPSARRVARELGVDLSAVPATGRNGVVRRADVESFAKGGGAGADRTGAPATPSHVAAAPQAPTYQAVALAPTDSETRVPFRGIRRKVAEAMTRSKHTAAHFTVVEEVDVTELVRLRAKAKVYGAKQGVKITYMPFIMKATAAALKAFPELNSQLDEATQEVVTYGHVNLGIATDTKNGLIVPVIPHVQAKGVMQLGAELQELAERTRAGKVKPAELTGGTFTITNAGNIGGILATPIINFPEVGILGVHRIVKRPGVVETDEGDVFEVRHYMNLSISVDHRLVDGASGARFLVLMKELLEEPGFLSF